MKGKSKWFALSLIAFLFAVLAVHQTLFSGKVKSILRSYLACPLHPTSGKSFDGAYILGGGQKSLEPKFKIASELYAEGYCNNIYILSRPGITEYNRSLGRNLTNDEWALMKLENYGVPRKAVQAVSIESGFFGTLSEAEGIAKLASEKDWKSLMLITSPHHTKRAKQSFDYFLSDSGVDVFVAASQNQAGLGELVLEFAKLKIYQVVLSFRSALEHLNLKVLS